MRELRSVQHSIFECYAEHEIGKELKAMSDWLDRNRVVLNWVAADLAFYLLDSMSCQTFARLTRGQSWLRG